MNEKIASSLIGCESCVRLKSGKPVKVSEVVEFSKAVIEDRDGVFSTGQDEHAS
jgi:hypothetical protein